MVGEKYVKAFMERKRDVLYAATKLFLKKGYTHTTMLDIAKESGVEKTAVSRAFGSKENILAELVKYVLEEQFGVVEKFLDGITEDRILFYAAETTLQLYMAESSEHIRDLYLVAYSLPNTSEIIQQTITDKLSVIFKDHLPHFQRSDFYELEIASGGIIRGFMMIPCKEGFTMVRKVARYLETTLLIYRVPDEKIKEAIAFVLQFNYEKLARQTIEQMQRNLESVI